MDSDVELLCKMLNNDEENEVKLSLTEINTRFIISCEKGDYNVAEYYANIGANRIDENDFTDVDLGIIIKDNRIDIINLLLKVGMSKNCILYGVCDYAYDNIEIVKLLIEHGADITNDDGESFSNACIWNNINIVKYTVEKFNLQLDYINEGFMSACENYDYPCFEVIKYLIGIGATDFDNFEKIKDKELDIFLYKECIKRSIKVKQSFIECVKHDPFYIFLLSNGCKNVSCKVKKLPKELKRMVSEFLF